MWPSSAPIPQFRGSFLWCCTLAAQHTYRRTAHRRKKKKLTDIAGPADRMLWLGFFYFCFIFFFFFSVLFLLCKIWGSQAYKSPHCVREANSSTFLAPVTFTILPSAQFHILHLPPIPQFHPPPVHSLQFFSNPQL